MLPSAQILMWQQLYTHLTNLPTASSADLKASLSETIELFEAALQEQDLDAMPDAIAGKMQSYLTESRRLLRLLPIDAMLMAAARTPSTSQSRQQAYQEKLNVLLQYCQAAIDLWQSLT
ncbi:heterocyst frequency control protein PatD [Chamaesiphon sp. VAR_69_metabat_338]|uniref:heterocyst frequency control protein PatD n=1 Tax=Chamaesiphon sp. VAR_69_metabat_338 TaxID=2964704 RepID=UPI00286E7F5F|nr:heterocyst frequency control protein PatD [Chamaesiphon sp. VAR_69_metabat_338]